MAIGTCLAIPPSGTHFVLEHSVSLAATASNLCYVLDLHRNLRAYAQSDDTSFTPIHIDTLNAPNRLEFLLRNRNVGAEEFSCRLEAFECHDIGLSAEHTSVSQEPKTAGYSDF